MQLRSLSLELKVFPVQTGSRVGSGIVPSCVVLDLTCKPPDETIKEVR